MRKYKNRSKRIKRTKFFLAKNDYILDIAVGNGVNSIYSYNY